MSNKIRDEITPEYYERYEEYTIKLAKAEEDIVILKSGLEVLEKRLMKEYDNAFKDSNNGKTLPEYLQRREAKADVKYMAATRALGKATSDKFLYRGKLAILDKVFDEWRTRSADRRGSI